MKMIIRGVMIIVGGNRRDVTRIGNDAISLSKEFSGKNGSKLAQRFATNAHAEV